jgi:phosphoglycerate dehydrogenase-like enzyme
MPKGVVLANAAGVHDASTSELAVGLLLASLRGIDDFARAMPTGTWCHERRRALADSTVAIIGFGGVGQALARRLAGFECEVVGFARTARIGPSGTPVHAAADLPAMLPRFDVVVLCVPLTAATTAMVDAKFLAAMADGSLLVNVARGPVVVTDALVAQCVSGRLRAALDVTDPEPLPADHPLWRAPNTLISPHVGGNTSAFLPRARRLVAEQLARLAAGEEPMNVVPRPLG